MNVEGKLEVLLQALNAMVSLPRNKLVANKGLVQEIRNIVNTPTILGIIEDLKQERFEEKRQAFYKKTNALHPDSNEFLGKYVDYQSAAFKVLSQQATQAKRIYYTEPVPKHVAGAFNAKKTVNPFKSKDVVELRQTKSFKNAFSESIEAYNSIYSNRALQIGTSQDPTIISSYIDYSPYVWNYRYYLSIPTLAQTIDRPINLATKMPAKIVFEDKELSKKIEHHLTRLQFNKLVVLKALRYAALSPRGSLTVPIEEEGRIRFNVFNDTQFTYSTSYQYSRMDFHDNSTGVSQLFCLGNLLQNEVTAHFNCPGFEPLYAIGKNRIYQLKDAAECINIYLYTIKVLCIRSQVLVSKWAGDGQNDSTVTAMLRMIRQVNQSLSLNTAVRLPEDADLQILNNNFSPGFADVAPVVKDYQGFLSDMMPDYLWGSQTAYAANNFNLKLTQENVRADYQIDQAEPIYRFCVNSILMRDERFKQYEGEKDNFDVEFPSLYEPTELEKEEINAKKIDNIQRMSDTPELEEIFKKEGMLRDEFTFQNLGNKDPNDELT